MGGEFKAFTSLLFPLSRVELDISIELICGTFSSAPSWSVRGSVG